MKTKDYARTMFQIPLLIASFACLPCSAAEGSANEAQLLEKIEQLEQRIAALEAQSAASSGAAQQKAAPSTLPPTAKEPERNATGDSLSLPGFASGTTLNFLLDGYYESNFNRPVGRVNLLRPFDPTSNSFTINQADIVIERAPNPSEGRRLGVRLDFMFGQTTESLSGNPANEPRRAPYRNIYQAYGTYVVPMGGGLSVDFGRFASSLGYEGTFTKDQMNYTRSFLFTALPFYHMGFRTSYKLSDATTATWLLVNGVNQMEDFNGFKSNHFMFSTSPVKNLSWTGSYYVGEESRDIIPLASDNFPPAIPTQPGLSIDPVVPRPNGKTHIADSYIAWTATPKLTLAAEGDFISNRVFSNSAPSHVAGGAAYLKYQLAPLFALAGRFEYVSDRGGLLSGATQALKEATVTATLQPRNGFQVRGEFRHDYSNQPFFLTSTPNVRRKEQNTLLVGLLWWFGGKKGSW